MTAGERFLAIAVCVFFTIVRNCLMDHTIDNNNIVTWLCRPFPCLWTTSHFSPQGVWL